MEPKKIKSVTVSTARVGTNSRAVLRQLVIGYQVSDADILELRGRKIEYLGSLTEYQRFH